MKFDRTDPSGGLEIYSAVSNGKATLEFKVQLEKTPSQEMTDMSENSSLVSPRGGYLDIHMWDRDGQPVFCCNHPLRGEESAKGLLLHPHLWQGTEDPYCYRVRVCLMEREDVCADVIEDIVALRSFREIPVKGWFLNDRLFPIKAVSYELSEKDSACRAQDLREERQTQIRQDLELLRKMGANTICLINGRLDREFCRLCDEAGFLLWLQDSGTADSPLSLRGRNLPDRYYFYKACWSKEPFVYINMTSLSFQRNGYAQVTVYSNQKKVALYVEGVLFEFKMDGPDFIFQEIPVKSIPLLLTAEAGSCSMSVTAYPFT